MADPMTPERLADRRKKIKAEHVERRYFYGAECSCGECLPCVVLADELAWLAEVERLRAELAKRPKSRLGEQVNRLSNAVGDLERERDDALAEVERLRAELAETTHVLAVTGEKADALRGQRDRAEAERDQAREQVKHVRELHAPLTVPVPLTSRETTVCAHCEVAYPCPTIRALDGAEPGQ